MKKLVIVLASLFGVWLLLKKFNIFNKMSGAVAGNTTPPLSAATAQVSGEISPMALPEVADHIDNQALQPVHVVNDEYVQLHKPALYVAETPPIWQQAGLPADATPAEINAALFTKKYE